MTIQPAISSWMLSALVIAYATAAFLAQPAAAQNASNLNCKGCVNSKDLRKNAVKTSKIRNKAVTEKKLSKALSGRLARPMLVDSTGKDIGPNVGRSRVIMASDVDGAPFNVTVRRLRFSGPDNIFFAGPSCTGQAYTIFTNRASDRAIFEANVWGNKAWVVRELDQILLNVSILSEASSDFVTGTDTCDAAPQTLGDARRLVAVKDLSGFTPPFSAEW